MIDGILPIDKPLGWTSHDVVARVRRLAEQRAVGHAGTLDPLASGVLLLVLGNATRLSPYLMDAPKAYCAEVILGATTVTDDAEAPVQRLHDVSHLGAERIERCLDRFRGDIDQIPPAYSAVRQGGQKLYTLARKGVEVEAPARRVTISGIRLVSWSAPRLRLHVQCGSGTYIRSLARDIGADLGVGGYLHALRRVRSGTFGLEECRTMDQLAGRADVARAILAPDRAVWHWPAIVLGPPEVRAARTGRALRVGEAPNGKVRLYDDAGALVALAESVAGLVKPYRVFDGGR